MVSLKLISILRVGIRSKRNRKSKDKCGLRTEASCVMGHVHCVIVGFAIVRWLFPDKASEQQRLNV